MAPPAGVVLIVEDDPINSEMIATCLDRAALRCIRVTHFAAAMEALAAEPVDLVIADNVLPDRSGLELLHYVKEKFPTLDVMLMTAYASMGSVLSAVGEGVYDYLVKPLTDFDDFTKRVQRALEKRRVMLENQRLIDYLRQANEQIESMNTALEFQVEERTRQLQELNRRLEELTQTDDVTGLHNQRFLYGRLEEEY
jgi:adenylate cyclase